jgi:hypothetical protein
MQIELHSLTGTGSANSQKRGGNILFVISLSYLNMIIAK